MPELRQSIQSCLQAFTAQPLRKASLSLLDTLGYRSDRTLILAGSKPQAFLDLAQSGSSKFDPEKALFSDWKSADILFQLTDDDIVGQMSTFRDVRSSLLRPHVPDRLFFDSGETADLSEVYGDKKRKAEKVTGLISILNRYKFTIVENTPIDQEIALDPELLEKVFENLLASYNEETKTTARKQTGSFYTPRPIVDYMVDESLKAHLECKLDERGAHAPSRVVSDALVGNHSDPLQDSASGNNPTSPVSSAMSSARAPKTTREGACAPQDAREARALPIRERLDLLFTYTEEPHPFSDPEVATLIAAIDCLKVLDPAYAPEASEAQQRDFLTHLHQTLNASKHPIRNRVLRLTSDSPDLLAVIKKEGKV